jgi:hypothetical protein
MFRGGDGKTKDSPVYVEYRMITNNVSDSYQ